MAPQEDQPGGKILVAAVMAVAATYVYFLLFAQFGFLRAVQAAGGPADRIKPILGLMGVAGIGGSMLAGRWFSSGGNQRLLGSGFAACAAGAGLALAGGPPAICLIAALLVGFGTGLTTVTLAGLLRPALGRARLGAIIGLGTGLAYAFCNWPGIFDATPALQAGLGVIAAGTGFFAATQLKPRTAENQPVGPDYAPVGIAIWVVFFLVLVGLDSAAFNIIQHSPALKAGTWSTERQLLTNAGTHLVGATLAGLALDRGWLGRVALLGAGSLLAGCGLLGDGMGAGAAGTLLYTAGVSVYSTTLVFYPANGRRPLLAALVYAVAGWGGSALGIALATDRQTLPKGWLIAAGLVIALALAARPAAGRARRA